MHWRVNEAYIDSICIILHSFIPDLNESCANLFPSPTTHLRGMEYEDIVCKYRERERATHRTRIVDYENNLVVPKVDE